MLKIVIIDDEINVRKVLKKLLALISSEYEVIAEATSIEEGKKVLEKNNPDIVLLDIQLEDGTGFSLIEQLPKIDFKLIFITAYNQYAIKAFKFNALDYLLKPINPEQLKTALNKAKETILAENEIQELLKNLQQNKNSEIPKIVVKTINKTYFLAVEKIQYCESDGAYTRIVMKDETVMASKNLKHFQELLSEYAFLRTHQSYLVNKTYISGFKNDFIFLNNGISIPVSTRRKSEIKALFLNK